MVCVFTQFTITCFVGCVSAIQNRSTKCLPCLLYIFFFGAWSSKKDMFYSATTEKKANNKSTRENEIKKTNILFLCIAFLWFRFSFLTGFTKESYLPTTSFSGFFLPWFKFDFVLCSHIRTFTIFLCLMIFRYVHFEIREQKLSVWTFYFHSTNGNFSGYSYISFSLLFERNLYLLFWNMYA